jgi:dTDP-4-dehydrorhamnose reductase
MEDKLILVTGSQGLIGSRFVEMYPQKNLIHAPKHIEFDISKSDEIRALFKSYEFKAVIHFAAMTDIFESEKERGDKEGNFWQINVEGTKNLANATSNISGLQFVYISTDKVFPGSVDNPGPYTENHTVLDRLTDLTWYGYTKLKAEQELQKIYGDKTIIIRAATPSRVGETEKSDFLRSILESYDKGNLQPLFDNQRITICSVDSICKTVEAVINKKLYGKFHVSSTNTVTPHELGTYLLQKTRGITDILPKISVEEFVVGHGVNSYLYPKLGGLDSKKTSEILGIEYGTWKQIVDSLILQGLGKKTV